MKTILLTGGTGLIGKEVGLALVRKGFNILALTRHPEQARLTAPYPAQWIRCDLEKEIPSLKEYSLHGVIHLAGENIGEQKWNQEQKTKILKSRTQGTRNLASALQGQKELNFVIGASAIGIYQPTIKEEIADENFPLGDNFLSEVTHQWEDSYKNFSQHLRKVLFRIGVVLSMEGGALPRMVFPAQIFASSRLGDGRQWLSWIHIDDVVSAIVTAAGSSSTEGTYNLVAPQPCQQKEIAHLIAKEMGAFHGPPVPIFALHALLGEQAQLATTSLRVSSHRWQASGFRFQYTNIENAVASLLRNWKNGQAVQTFKQYFPLSREKIFNFFCSTQNLEKITPPHLNFQVLRSSTTELEPGTLIDYKLKVHGIPLRWTTRIETWEKNKKFTDTQEKGPYALWHHTHLFEDVGAGTLMTDQIIYKLPMGLIGRAIAQRFVDNDIKKIFEFRRQNVEKCF